MTLSKIPKTNRIKKGIDPKKKKILFVLGLIFVLVVLYGIYSLKRVDRKSTRLNYSHIPVARMPSSA